MMDLTTIATLLGIPALPSQSANGDNNGTTTSSVKPPPWWPGDDAAAESSIEAARQMGFVVGSVN